MALRATALLNWMMVLRALARLTLMARSQYGRPSRRLSRPFIPKRKHKYSVQVIYLLATPKFRSGSSYSVGFRARFVLHASLSRSLQPMLHAARDCTRDPQQRLCCAIGPDGATPSRPSKWAFASVSSLLRCTAYSPQRTKCAHNAAWSHASQQMRGCLTGTSFSLVRDGFQIETPLVHSGRRLAGC